MKQKTLWVILFILFSFEIAFAGVPIPWGAKLIREDITITGNGGERKMAFYDTKANKQELFNYYLREMPNQGYSLFMNGELNLIFNKGDDLVVVFIPPSRDGKTQFMVGASSLRSPDNKTNKSAVVEKCDPIPFVPAYRGARCIRSMRQKSGGSISASYSVNDSIDTVLNFYRMQMPQYAWQLEKELEMEDLVIGALQSQDQMALTSEQQAAMHDFYGGARGLIFTRFQKDICSVQVMSNPVSKSVTLINIVYEEKISK